MNLKYAVFYVLEQFVINLIFDFFLNPFFNESTFLKCMKDNLAHGIISALIWKQFLLCKYEGSIFEKYWLVLYEIFIALTFSSLLDIDHFIAANSFNLKDATNLQFRPFGHSIFFLFIVSTFFYLYFESINFSIMFFSSCFSHQIRDAKRRGLYVFEGVNTKPISNATYLFTILVLPYISYYTSNYLISSKKNKKEEFKSFQQLNIL